MWEMHHCDDFYSEHEGKLDSQAKVFGKLKVLLEFDLNLKLRGEIKCFLQRLIEMKHSSSYNVVLTILPKREGGYIYLPSRENKTNLQLNILPERLVIESTGPPHELAHHCCIDP